MNTIYNNIKTAISNKERLLAVLLDPDKVSLKKLPLLIDEVNRSIATHIFVGGSIVEEGVTDPFVNKIKERTTLPVLIFPGDITQISHQADGLLFLSLLSGRNPEYLIEKQVKAVSILKNSQLEVVPTAYLLIENGKETAVQRVSGTLPMSRDNTGLITDTAKAGELLGMKLVYLEAGSGAIHPVNEEIIKKVSDVLEVPLIVGGGIRNKQQLDNAYEAGADMVVIGTAFEDNNMFFKDLKPRDK